LLVFGLCISLIPISIITTVYYLNARSALKEQILKDFHAIAESKKIHIISLIQSKKGRTVDFSSDGFIRDSLETISHRGYQSHVVADLNRHLLVNKKPIDSYLDAIAIVNMDGIVVSSTSEKWIGKDISDQEIFSQVAGKPPGETYVNPISYCPYIDKECIDISTPITSANSVEKIGVIINCYVLESLNEITTNRIGIGKTGEVYLVNKDKMMITESRFIADAPFNQVVDTEPVRKILESGEEMTGIYSDYRGVSIVGASVNILEYGWILLVEMDKVEAFAPLRGLGIVALIVGSVCGAAAIGVGIFFSTSTAKPINRLKYAAERIASGDLRYRVDIDRKDEIGVLANSFNAMTEELTKKKRELQARIYECTCAEEQIKASLKEKEVLLREVHHRVKNNLQIISSLLDMSSMQTENQETIDLFADSRNRVNAMALIHTQLYGSERFDKINMEEHILELSKNLLQIYSMEKIIALNIKSANIYLNINQAIPCALVLNELVSNVLKHAYREGQKGTLSISMQQSGGDTILLRIKDDGAGIPEDIDIEKTRSLGLSIVRNLVNNQLKGKIKVSRNKGTEFLIDFKIKGVEV
jgi:two-component sensor histidine kinase